MKANIGKFMHGTDRRGHSAYLHLRVPPEMEQALSAVFDQRDKSRLPYRTRSDIVRDAIGNFLEELESQQKTGAQASNALGRLAVVQSIIALEEEQAAFEDVVQKLNASVAKFSSDRDGQAEARRHVQEVWDKVCEFPEGYWKRRLKKTIKLHHPQYVNKQFSTDPEEAIASDEPD